MTAGWQLVAHFNYVHLEVGWGEGNVFGKTLGDYRPAKLRVAVVDRPHPKLLISSCVLKPSF